MKLTAKEHDHWVTPMGAGTDMDKITNRAILGLGLRRSQRLGSLTERCSKTRTGWE